MNHQVAFLIFGKETIPSNFWVQCRIEACWRKRVLRDPWFWSYPHDSADLPHEIKDPQPQNGHPCHPREAARIFRATPLPCLPRCRPWRSPVLRRRRGCLCLLPENSHPNSKSGKSVHWFTQTYILDGAWLIGWIFMDFHNMLRFWKWMLSMVIVLHCYRLATDHSFIHAAQVHIPWVPIELGDTWDLLVAVEMGNLHDPRQWISPSCAHPSCCKSRVRTQGVVQLTLRFEDIPKWKLSAPYSQWKYDCTAFWS